VSVAFVVRLMKSFRAMGRLAPKPSGGRRHAKLDPHRTFLLGRIAEKADMMVWTGAPGDRQEVEGASPLR
jgi:transposase